MQTAKISQIRRSAFHGESNASASQAKQFRPRAKAASKKSQGITCEVANERDPSKRIVITGMGVVSCFGNDYDKMYDKLLAGTSGVGEIDRFDITDYPTKFAAQIRDFDSEGYIDRKSDRRLDDCLRYSLTSGLKALEDAGLPRDQWDTLDKTRCGILVGSGMGGLTVFQDGVKALVNKGPKKITPFFIPFAITNMGGALLGIETGFMGPNYSISTACATANYCFKAAADHLRNGDADLIVAGGSEAAIVPIGLGGFVACRALSQNNEDPTGASRPWDKNRDGFVMGEGAGVLVMETLEHALARGARIHAEYLGGGITCDAHHMTEPRKDGLGVGTCIKNALGDAGLSYTDIQYINAHATSTPAGDMAEVNAVKSVFKTYDHVKMNGTKSMMGHCLGAAAGIEAVATIQAIKTGVLHPTLNQDDLEDAMDMDTVANVKAEHEVTAALSNSFGFGGHNSSVIFGKYRGE
ncbi:3-oxoacyl-[acyl-carrier-protein] synthase I [Cymbomonas tetramitiformis]|uniref:3-oxoacyl-[acyl-carrier-protein] synthase n=1 Tax=Cymbomonas tetramitiformis TaxID=36881 RepID=A0AAE0CEY9_9CHLO|nr:3-oxoacyl-[acyl-carrier-protein] synthase I [Cymbomonas tetramitiformis]